jgi:type II secretory pathway component PulF
MTSEMPDVFDNEPLAPLPPTRGARVTGAVMAMLGGVAWVALLTILLTVVPRFENIFIKFDIPGGLPDLTRGVIAASHAVSRMAIIVLPMVTIGTFLLVGFSVADRRRTAITISTIFGIVSCLIVTIFGALIVYGILNPFMNIMTHVSSGRSGGG